MPYYHWCPIKILHKPGSRLISTHFGCTWQALFFSALFQKYLNEWRSTNGCSMAKGWTYLTRIVTSGSTVGQSWKGQSQESHRAGLALYLAMILPDHARWEIKPEFYPCSNTGHATKLPTFPGIPTRSLTVLDWRKTFWWTEMSNKEGTNTGNSCAALVRHQEQVPPAELESHPHTKLGETQPHPGCCGGCGFQTHLLLVALLF